MTFVRFLFLAAVLATLSTVAVWSSNNMNGSLSAGTTALSLVALGGMSVLAWICFLGSVLFMSFRK